MVGDKTKLTFKEFIFINAYYWMQDNKVNPIITIQRNFPGVLLPEHITNETCLLNIGSRFISNFSIDLDNSDNKAISFNTTIRNNPIRVTIPLDAILSIIDQETGIGLDINDLIANPKKDPEDNGKPLEKDPKSNVVKFPNKKSKGK